MKSVSLKPIALTASACLLFVAGCASFEPPPPRAAVGPGKMQADEKFAYTGSRIPTKNSAGHVVQVDGVDYMRSLPNNPGTPLMAGQVRSGGQ